MKYPFTLICEELNALICEWKIRLMSLSGNAVSSRQNSQGRTIKEIVGHMIDSATNNTHRIIHMHYQDSPVQYPDYANLGNNDRWIAIQNYQEEDWELLVALWVTTNRHIVHVIGQIDESKLGQIWTSALNDKVSLEAMITDFPRHFKLHLQEIEELI
jgi:hypothetical protein